MIEDMMLPKGKKSSSIEKTIENNLSNLKKMAEKNGISINELIKLLKKGE